MVRANYQTRSTNTGRIPLDSRTISFKSRACSRRFNFADGKGETKKELDDPRQAQPLEPRSNVTYLLPFRFLPETETVPPARQTSRVNFNPWFLSLLFFFCVYDFQANRRVLDTLRLSARWKVLLLSVVCPTHTHTHSPWKRFKRALLSTSGCQTSTLFPREKEVSRKNKRRNRLSNNKNRSRVTLSKFIVAARTE